MLWIGIGVTLVVVMVLMGVHAGRRRFGDHGSVSDQWLTQHRAER
jgi:hypothetical protein